MKELPEQKELVTVCQPNGHCIYTLTPERTAILYAQYKHTMNTRPRLINKLKPNNFAEELHRLLTRYKDGASITKNQTIKIKNHWATPTTIYAALKQLTRGY
jgi:hypothetical protein